MQAQTSEKGKLDGQTFFPLWVGPLFFPSKDKPSDGTLHAHTYDVQGTWDHDSAPYLCIPNPIQVPFSCFRQLACGFSAASFFTPDPILVGRRKHNTEKAVLLFKGEML